MKDNKGFTLIELLASITLIVLLFIIIVPTSLNLIEKSNKEQCQKMANAIEANAELCVLDKNSICLNKTEVSLTDLYNNGYIEEKYENKYKEEEITKLNSFKDYKISITKHPSDLNESKSYLEYMLVDSLGNDPCID